MLKLKSRVFGLTSVFFASTLVIAQPPGGGRGPGGGFGPPGGRPGGPGGFGGPGGGASLVLLAIDADGDHVISAVEIKQASAALAKLDLDQDGKLDQKEIHGEGGSGGGRGFGPDGGPGRGGRDGGPGQRDGGPRGPRGDGPGGQRGGGEPDAQRGDGLGPPRGEARGDQRGGGPRGFGGPPSPEQFVALALTFDADKDGKLSRSELEKLAEEMGRRGPPGRGGPGGRGFGRGGDGEGQGGLGQRGQGRRRPELDDQ